MRTSSTQGTKAVQRGPSSPAERRFAAYLDLAGIRWVHEAAVADKFPDFTVFDPAGTYIAEVYEPEEDVDPAGGWRDPTYLAAKFLRQRRKREQIAAAHAAGLPAVAVLGQRLGGFRIDGWEAAVALFGLKGQLGPDKFNDLSALAIVSDYNPTAEILDREFERRRAPRRSPHSREETVREAAEYLKLAGRLQQSGACDADRRLPCITVLRNPYATFPLDQGAFKGDHDTQWHHDGSAATGTDRRHR